MKHGTESLDLSADLIEVRDLIARFEDLQRADLIEVRDLIARFEDLQRADLTDESERRELEMILDELKGGGGDEQWRGNRYPSTLIRGSYAQTYARLAAEDVSGAELGDAVWPFTCIDWEKATDEFLMDYMSVEVDGDTYWYR